MIRTLIIDDEPNAREDLKKQIGIDHEFNIVGTCKNAFEAIKDINRKRPDVAFLDIKMPRVSGIEMLSMLDKDTMPRIVFVTAHGEYAIEAFENNAIDFLLKPVKSDRLSVTLARLKENHKPQPIVAETFSTELKFVPCCRDGRYYLINIKEIIHVYSCPTTGVHLVTGDGGQAFQTNLSLKVFDENSPLKRCHRQHMINPDYIKYIEKLDNGLGRIYSYANDTIPVSRNYMDNFPAIA